MAFDFTKDLEIGGVETNVNVGQVPSVSTNVRVRSTQTLAYSLEYESVRKYLIK